MKNVKSILYIYITIFIMLGLTFSSLIFAQGGGGQGGGNSDSDNASDNAVQDRDRDREQIQDPVANTGDEPIQDRVRDQDRTQDSQIIILDQPIQNRDQLRDRILDQIEDPDQARDRDRIRINDPAGLKEIIETGEAVSNDFVSGLSAEIRELERNRNRVEVGVMALIAAQNSVGKNGQQLSNLAQEIQSAHRTMTQQEEQISERGLLNRFFFGGDKDSAGVIQAHLQQNEQRMQQIRQYIDECDDEQIRALLQEQIRKMEEEHIRLQQLAEDEVSSWGILSWRF